MMRLLVKFVNDDAVVGKVCNVTSIIVFLSPIQILYRVFREKNNYFLIPIYTAWVSLFSTGCWVAYGILISDVYIQIPNIIGIILAIIQICTYIVFKRKYPTIGERDRDTSTIDIDNTIDDKKETNNIKDDEENQNNIREKPVKISSKFDS